MSLNPLRRGATQLGESVTNIPTQNYRTRRFGYELSPLDVQQNTRDPTYQRDRLTEMLGEVGVCTNEASPGYTSDVCQAIRSSSGGHPWALVEQIVSPFPGHDSRPCSH